MESMWPTCPSVRRSVGRSVIGWRGGAVRDGIFLSFCCLWCFYCIHMLIDCLIDWEYPYSYSFTCTHTKLPACGMCVSVCARSSWLWFLGSLKSIAFLPYQRPQDQKSKQQRSKATSFCSAFWSAGEHVCSPVCVVGGTGWGKRVGFNTQGDWFKMGWLAVFVCVCV